MGIAKNLLLLAAAVGVALGGPAAADFEITALPGLKEKINFKHYAGYMPIEDAHGTELFFWFVESQRDPTNDPVVLWLNGGPGSSSVKYGFWAEHGPFRLQPGDGPGGYVPTLYDQAWNKIANVLYVEAPAGVGYSFSADTTKYRGVTDQESSYDNFLFLKAWFKAFPQFKANDFYITAESYGGHYGPTLAEQLIDNENDVNMRGLLIGNPGINSDWYFNVNEYAFTTFMWSHGFLPALPYIEARKTCGWEEFFTDCARDYTHPDAACKAAVNRVLRYLPNSIDNYDVDADVCLHHGTQQHVPNSKRAMPPLFARLTKEYNLTLSPGYNPCQQNWADAYMNSDEVMKAIHVAEKFPGPKGRWPSDARGWYYDQGAEGSKKDIALIYPKFFEKRPEWKLVVVSGTSDAAVPFLGTERWMNCLGRDVARDWRGWALKNGQMGGTVKYWDTIGLVTVRGCGHTIPTYCPEAGFEFFENWLTDSWPRSY